jgi:TonB family protein
MSSKEVKRVGMSKKREAVPMSISVYTILSVEAMSADTTGIYSDYSGGFPGGKSALNQYIKENMVYPEIDKQLANQGTVYVQFVVEVDGSISDMSIAKGISDTIDREALRFIRTMPNWIPSRKDNEFVRTRIRLPLHFTMQ